MGYEFSCVMVLCPDDVNEDFQSLSRHLVEDGELYENPQDPSFGRPEGMHVTALYGIREAECDERVMKVVEQHLPLSFTIVGFGSFQEPKMPFDVIKLDVESQSLRALNAALKEEFPDNANTFPEYKPHVTLAYVQKGLAPGILKRVEGQELKLEIPVSQIEISRNDGKHNFYEV